METLIFRHSSQLSNLAEIETQPSLNAYFNDPQEPGGSDKNNQETVETLFPNCNSIGEITPQFVV